MTTAGTPNGLSDWVTEMYSTTPLGDDSPSVRAWVAAAATLVRTSGWGTHQADVSAAIIISTGLGLDETGWRPDLDEVLAPAIFYPLQADAWATGNIRSWTDTWDEWLLAFGHLPRVADGLVLISPGVRTGALTPSDLVDAALAEQVAACLHPDSPVSPLDPRMADIMTYVKSRDHSQRTLTVEYAEWSDPAPDDDALAPAAAPTILSGVSAHNSKSATINVPDGPVVPEPVRKK